MAAPAAAARACLPPPSPIAALRRADWLDASRASAWRNVLLAMSAVAVAGWVALSHGGLDRLGKPLGTDFLSFYAASKLALWGHPAAAYDVEAHRAAQAAVFGRDVGYFAFFYPPLFLLICAPLAALPYLAALAAWLGATGAAFVAVARRWLEPQLGGVATILAFPAVLLTLGHGQNAFLSAALLGFGALMLDRRPVLAGVAFGLLAYKPHLGLMLPFALLFARRWTTFAAAAATVLAFAALSLLAFGPETWRGFLAGAPLARATLEQGLVDPGKMTSAFAAVRDLGGPIPLAYAVQAAVVAACAAGLWLAQRRSFRGPAEPALIVLASLLASPFALDYDLLLLAFPVAWLGGEGLRHGFRPWEKLALLAGFALPLLARPLAMHAHLPIAPLVLLALSALVLRRAGALNRGRAPLPLASAAVVD